MRQKTSPFFAYMSRMKLIRRWGLMRNTREEDIAQHSLQVAMVAHALAVIRNREFGGHTDPEHVMALAVYHEAGEVITGDMPTPIKYFNPEIRKAYHAIEDVACHRLLDMLPEALRADYQPLLLQPREGEGHALVKAADKLCAYLKCVEEERSGNDEFRSAKAVTLKDIEAMGLPEVERFLQLFGQGFGQTLDELNQGGD